MANFCNQCGRQLQDGEVCNCQQQNVNQNQTMGGMPNQAQQPYQQFQNNMGNMPYQGYPQQNPYGMMGNQVVSTSKNIFQEIANIFKDPIGTTKRLADEDKMTMPLTMVIINIVAVFLLSIIYMIVARVKLADYASWVSIPYVKIVLIMTIVSAIYDFALAGLTLLSTKVFFKEDISFAKALTLVGTKVIIDTLVLIVAAILAILSTALGGIVLSAGMIFTTLMFVMSYQKLSSLSDTKKFYSLFVTFVMQAVVMGIVYAVLYESFVTYIQSILYYM